MHIKATTQHLHMGPKKVREVVDLIRGLGVRAAEDQLRLLRRHAARPVLKVLRSAVANAEHNFDLVEENLYIETISVNEGPMQHRWTPRAFGRATPIRKRSSHIEVVLSEREEGKRGGRARREEDRSKRVKKHATARHEHADEKKKPEDADAPKQAGVTAEPRTPSRVAARHDKGRTGKRGFIKRIFNRKAG